MWVGLSVPHAYCSLPRSLDNTELLPLLSVLKVFSECALAKVQHVDWMEYCGAGALPAEWGQNGSFQALSTFSFSSQRVNGTLPAEWSNPMAFQLLEDFELLNSSVTGTVSINVKARTIPGNVAA